jgi:hypothetical protein
MIVVALIPLYLPTQGLVGSHTNTGMFYFIFLSSFYISKCRRKTIGQSERGDEIKGKRRVKRIEGRNTQNRRTYHHYLFVSYSQGEMLITSFRRDKWMMTC